MPAEPEYPEALEQAWLSMACGVTGRTGVRDAAAALETEAAAVSDAFTTGRDPRFAGYAENARALTAYGLYFFPRAFVRTARIMRECADRIRAAARPPVFRVLDLGAGTGAAALSAAYTLQTLAPSVRADLTLVDCAKPGLDTAADLARQCRHLWPGTNIRCVTADARTFRSDERYDLIICSFAVNEWMQDRPSDSDLFDWTRGWIGSLNPDGLLMLTEPSQHFAVERMIRLRDRLAAESAAAIVAPCPHRLPCPMQAEKRGWCHEVRTWQPPQSMHWINARLQRDIRTIKHSMLVAARPETAKPADWMRIVSPVKKEKGKFSFFGCGPDGALHTCEWLNRKLTDRQAERSQALERGDRVIWKPEKTLGDKVTERSGGPPEPAS